LIARLIMTLSSAAVASLALGYRGMWPPQVLEKTLSYKAYLLQQ